MGSNLGSAAQADPAPPKLSVDVLRAKLDAAIVAESAYPFGPTGKQWRFFRSELIAWIKANPRKTGT